jgi:hypothetical protein
MLTLAAAMFAAGAVRADEAPRLRVRGMLDLAVHNNGHSAEIATYDGTDSPFGSQRLRLFVEGSASANVDVFTQLLLKQDEVILDGAYALITPWVTRDLHLMAGKIPAPVGAWAPRTYSTRNPLVAPPLMYQYHSSLRWDSTPMSKGALLAAAGTGWAGADYGSGAGSPGMPVVDDYGWDFGVVAVGSVPPLEFSVGTTNSAPSWGSPGEDVNRGKAVLGRVGLAPTAGVRFGVSGAQGSYLGDWVRWAMPAGKDENDYPQTLAMGDLELERGHAELRAEGFANAWETPRVGTLRSKGGYGELRYGFDNGVWLATRAEAIRFDDITAGALTRSWDDDVDRLEVGLGYRIARGAAIKADWQRTRLHPLDGEQTFDLFASQLSLEF